MKNHYLLAILLLVGCAYSPQQIEVNPIIPLDGERYGSGRSVTVLVEDQRDNKILGSRGGVYRDSSVITLAGNLTESLVKVGEAKLAAQGFNVNSGATEAAQLKIIIEDVQYTTPEQTVGKKVKLLGVLRAELSYQGERYTGRYRTQSERQLVVAPSKKANEEMINTLFSDLLVRLFLDKKLQAFLTNI